MSNGLWAQCGSLLLCVSCCSSMAGQANAFGPGPSPAPPAKPSGDTVKVLIVYENDMKNSTGQLAAAVKSGAEVKGATVMSKEVQYANYKRDVAEWADCVVLGSGVYNENASPRLLEFINTFDFNDDLTNKIGGSFATGGQAGAGVQMAVEQLSRGLRSFGMITVGGSSWKNAEGTSAIVNSTGILSAVDLASGASQGSRIATVAKALKQSMPSNATGCTGTTCPRPPSWGTQWSARVSANLTQPGYDAGLVIVNFTTKCDDPHKQQMKTVYGDYYTVLTRCDLGWEWTIAPASRGGNCTAKLIGRDVDERICGACGCPFCVRDTQGSYTHGENSGAINRWTGPTREVLAGITVDVWTGTAESTGSGAQPFTLATSVAFLPDGVTPAFVNVSHPLWVQTAASVVDFNTVVSEDVFLVPKGCPAPYAMGK